ncbi:MAG: HrpE/YscL family type III secretion apparatus protein [Parachlamydiales bacterium]|nr:HrpE/YscL family type III secretion apparatus protein [Parachlamydiales bacterium]
MKFFSFLKEEIHPSPGDKVIKKEDFSKIIEIENLLEKANEDIIAQKEKTLEECENLKKEAEKKGFDEGLEKLNEKIIKLDEAIEKLNQEYESKILPIALKAAKKIVSEELKLHPERIKQVILQALRPVIEHHMIKIFVNRNDFLMIENEKEKIKEVLKQVKTFSLEPRDDIEPGGCIIETEAGIINAQLENQFRAIEAAFEKFMKK